MKGIYPIKYFKTPLCDKPLEEIWDDIDAYTGEFFEDEPQHFDKIDLFVQKFLKKGCGGKTFFKKFFPRKN